MTNPDVKALLVEVLRAQGFDGLWSDGGGCACIVDDLVPCDGPCHECQAGYLLPKPWPDHIDPDGDFCIGEKKAEVR
jgi:hypothetical protein